MAFGDQYNDVEMLELVGQGTLCPTPLPGSQVMPGM